MRSGPALLLCLAVSTVAFAAPPRVTFERLIPAPYDLGQAEKVAITGALGDTQSIELLVELIIEQTSRTGTLRVFDARGRASEPADAYLSIRAFTCATETRTGEGTVHDVDGKRVRRKETWVETRCTGRLDVRTESGTRASLGIKGEGASSHVEAVSDEERDDALMHATRFAAIDAAEKIAPRRVRESISLDETAPRFEEGLAMIAAGRLAEARAIWEKEMRRSPRAAPLHFNLAAVCEAVGDRAAAEQHYVAARQLAPEETRYSSEYKLFLRRGTK